MKTKDLISKLRIDLQLLSINDLESMDSKSLFIFDIETPPNKTFALFKNHETSKFIYFEQSEDETFDANILKWFLSKFIFVGFNNKAFDEIILAAMLDGRAPKEVYEIASGVIYSSLTPYLAYKTYGLTRPMMNSFDLMPIAPLQGSLKIYSARLNCPVIQELPYEPSKSLDFEERIANRLYCANDCNNTEILFKKLIPEIKLRYDMSEMYGLDLRSKSDAQIAEAVIVKEIEKLKGERLNKIDQEYEFITYDVPDYINFKTPQLNSILESIKHVKFELGFDGSPKMPTELADLTVTVGNTEYNIGMGGLHSKEKSVSYWADDGMELADNDVESYYPRIIINNQLYPELLGKDFLNVYESIVNRRLKAKKDGDKTIANSLKITINGSFGKLGNKYSYIYAPKLLLQVTITGQLSLLMLIEMLELEGINVISGNTDGIVSYYKKSDREKVRAIINEWEIWTNFKTEETLYTSIHSRDVNNYIAVKTDGKVKTKGTYVDSNTLQKNPENLIISDAVIAYLKNGAPVEETVLNCKDLTRFISVRNVKGGGYKDEDYLGKVVRFYKSKSEQTPITYASGNKVSNSDYARPLMVMYDSSDIPDDIDYNWYIQNAKLALFDLGILKQYETPNLF